MRSLLDMFVTECEYKNLSPLTVKTYKTDIGYLIEFLEGIGVTDIEKLTLTHLKRWVVKMQKRPLYAGMHRENPDKVTGIYRFISSLFIKRRVNQGMIIVDHNINWLLIMNLQQ